MSIKIEYVSQVLTTTGKVCVFSKKHSLLSISVVGTIVRNIRPAPSVQLAHVHVTWCDSTNLARTT